MCYHTGMGIRRAPAALLVSIFMYCVSSSAVGAVELKFVGSKKEIFKSSVKAIGKGLEAGDVATILRSSRAKESLLSIHRLFYSRKLPKPIALRCRYGAAPKRKRTLDLNHAVEVRVEVPLDIQLKDAALSFSVDGSSDRREEANVLFSFSF